MLLMYLGNQVQAAYLSRPELIAGESVQGRVFAGQNDLVRGQTLDKQRFQSPFSQMGTLDSCTHQHCPFLPRNLARQLRLHTNKQSGYKTCWLMC